MGAGGSAISTQQGLAPVDGSASGSTGVVREVRYAPPIWRQWNLIWNFAQRDLKSKFKGSALGWAWSFVVPLATLAIYTIVFSVIFRAAPPAMGNGRVGVFVIWLFGGLTSWSFFASSINAGMAGLLTTGTLLKKIYFPAYAPVLGSVVAVGVQSLIELGLYLAVLAFMLNVGWSWLLIPLWTVLLAVFSSALSTALSILNVYARDLAHVVGVALQLFFYATPIIYNLAIVPSRYHGVPLRALVELLPVSLFVESLRDISYGLTEGTLERWGGMVLWTVLAVGFAALVNNRRGKDLGEEL